MALQDFVPHELKDQKTVFNALSRNKWFVYSYTYKM